MITSAFRWHVARPPALDPGCVALAAERGISTRLLGVLAARGVVSADDLGRFLAPPEDGLFDPRLLPDAAAALRRVETARSRGEKVMVFGDFDADGLTGLSILVLALRSLGLDVAPYVPERLADGHGLSKPAVERAALEGRKLIVTADCGTSSSAEIDLAASRGIDVIVTDHHHAQTWPAAAVAVVNPMRADSAYPEHGLTGAGVAWKFAHLLAEESGGSSREAGARAPLPRAVLDLADLALIGTVADVAALVGENRSIAQLGLERLRSAARPGLSALMARAGVAADRLDLDDVGFAIAPRLNAAGRVGEAARAARLLLATDAAQATALAEEIEQANLDRREITRRALVEARRALGLDPAVEGEIDVSDEKVDGGGGATTGTAPGDLPAALILRGEWPVGIVGLIAGRLAEDFGRPAVVATDLDAEAGTLRASCRSGGGVDLARALVACSDLLIRHGGHRAAAGFDIAADRWPEFAARFMAIVAAEARVPVAAGLAVDMVVPAEAADYGLVREIGLLAPTGPGNPLPNVAVTGLTVVRVRAASGGHTQLVLRRRLDVIDAVAFRRADLAAMLHEGDRIDLVGRIASRRFGGIESIQVEVLDVSGEGAQLRPIGLEVG